ncbi:MAG: hypothetical protein KC457_34620, partial [Myxococcales bacterium]|nr:hypothetical protein [Myxococcales bacterium]
MTPASNEQAQQLAIALSEALANPEEIVGAKGMASLRALLGATAAYDTTIAGLAEPNSPEALELLRRHFEAVMTGAGSLRRLLEQIATRLQTPNGIGVVAGSDRSAGAALTELSVNLDSFLAAFELEGLQQYGFAAPAVPAPSEAAPDQDPDAAAAPENAAAGEEPPPLEECSVTYALLKLLLGAGESSAAEAPAGEAPAGEAPA